MEPARKSQDLTEQLIKLSKLHGDGALSDDEFKMFKAKLISGTLASSNKARKENHLQSSKQIAFSNIASEEQFREVEQSNSNSVVMIDGESWASTIIRGIDLWIYLIVFGEFGFLTLYAIFAIFFL
jgi:hypothetical protein